MNPFPRLRSVLLAALSLAAVTSCVDAPAAPEGAGAPAAFVIAPVFSLVGPDGPALSEGQEGALSEAFDLVNRFRIVVRRANDRVVVLDTVKTVPPGQEQYDLSLNLDAKVNDQFLVTITALQGETELFTAQDIPATASPLTVPGSAPPAALQIPLVYSGPGASAASVTVGSAQVVLATGSAATLQATARDDAGTAIPGVPLAWTTSAPSVATVSGGQITAVGEGVATITVTSPTGKSASARAYVVNGQIAYVEGGALKVRDVAGGTPVDRGSAASQPSWSADGSQLFFVSGGSVQVAGGGTVVGGTWPALSPDGTKFAIERSGQVYFSNSDGSVPTPGPSGTSPVWLDGAHLLVGGGSIERVRADGSGRETVMAGAATLPALAADGRVAAIVGSDLRVSGGASPLVTGATGRPTWSPNGAWLVVGTGAGLVLVPADGSAPAVPLPGLGGAGDPAWRPGGALSPPPTVSVCGFDPEPPGPRHPAWRPGGALSPPPSVSVSGFDPEPPVPGSPVKILGSGFDWIIPANNAVTWPTRTGSVVSEITSVTGESITTVMPRTVIAGQVRVGTRSGDGVLPFTPTVGGLDVTAQTPWGAPLAGVGLRLTGPGGTLTLSTGSGGTSEFTALTPGSYTLEITAPDGFTVVGNATVNLNIGAAIDLLTVVLNPRITSVALSPSAPVVGVGSDVAVSLQLSGPGGIAIPQADGLVWRSVSPELRAVAGSGLAATLSGIFAGAGSGTSVLEVDVAGATHAFPVSVPSRIEGLVTLANGQSPAPPAPGVTVDIVKGGQVVAQGLTGANGRYSVPGLFRGTYDVVPQATGTLLPVPAGQTVTLDQANPSGTADFQMQSFAGLDVTAKTPWAAPVSGVKVTVKTGEGTELASGETNADGTVSLTRIPAGSHVLHVLAPGGFQLTGDPIRAITLAPGKQSLAVEVTPLVDKVRTVPEVLSVETGQTVDVQLVPVDVRGNTIPVADPIQWSAGSDGFWTQGTGTQGVVGGIYPSPRNQPFVLNIDVSGTTVSIPVTVTSYLRGTVTRDAESQVSSVVSGTTGTTSNTTAGTVAASGVVLNVSVGGVQVAQLKTNGFGQYHLGGLAQATYVIEPVPPEGYVATPVKHTVALGSEMPHAVLDFKIVKAPVTPPPGAGEVIVVGDINYWGSSPSYIEAANNKEMTRNLASSAGRNNVVWYFGHNTYNYSLYNASYFYYAKVYLENTVGLTVSVVDNTTTGGLNLPLDAASWWFWMPQASFNTADVAYINQYLAGGGRVILVGENNNSVFNLANQRVQELMNALGSAGVYTDACYSGTASEVTTDPLTKDITAIQTACSSYVTLGTGDQSLIRQSGASVVTRIRLGAPVNLGAPVTTFTPGLVQSGTTTLGDPALGPVGSGSR